MIATTFVSTHATFGIRLQRMILILYTNGWDPDVRVLISELHLSKTERILPLFVRHII